MTISACGNCQYLPYPLVKYSDIVQRDFVEHYRNITRKHITVMEWLSITKCSHLEYLVKVDDDTFVDVFHLVRLLRTDQTVLRHAFYCSATANAKPSRPNGKKSKWVITYSEFPKLVFPPYCEGLGYIADATLAPSIYWCAAFVSPLWVDDVYVTGILAERLHMPRYAFKPGHSYDRVGPMMRYDGILDNIFLTSFYNEYLPETFHRLWHTVLDKSMNLP